MLCFAFSSPAEQGREREMIFIYTLFSPPAVGKFFDIFLKTVKKDLHFSSFCYTIYYVVECIIMIINRKNLIHSIPRAVAEKILVCFILTAVLFFVSVLIVSNILIKKGI